MQHAAPQLRPTQTLLKSLRLRVSTLRAELHDHYTIQLGTAAVACVQRALDDAEYRLEQAERAA